MIVLGISAFFHDSSATLVKDGLLIAAAEEERFTRIKHDSGFPHKSIDYCLSAAGITITDVDYVCFYEKPILKFERVMLQFIESFPRSFFSFYKALPSWINQKLRVHHLIRKRLKFKKTIFFIDHHMAHAASAYLVSPFTEAALLTMDGVGEWATTTIGYAKGTQMTLDKQISFPHSVGLLYSAVTAHLGFKVNNSEYKVMGLSAYGRPIYYEQFKKLIDIKDDGSYALDMDYFLYHYKMAMPGKKFIEAFGPLRKPHEPVTQRHKDIAASLQKITEEAIFTVLRALYKKTKCKNLCMAGGVALNSVANGKILRETQFENVFIQPSAGDGGNSLGAAFYAYNVLLDKPRQYVMEHAYLGPRYSSDEIKHFLESNTIRYRTFSSDVALVKETAQLLHQKKVIGWLQQSMEFGPRALGARSILASPCEPDMQDILNLKVKHREAFRPFAPAVCEDDAATYFDCDAPVPLAADFMLMVYPIKKDKRKYLPAVTHVDGTGRLQVVRRKHNPRYYDLIKAFGKLSGVPILVNTSFNIRGEPIVCTPYEAYRCMMGTGIDALVMDRFLIKRDENPQDIWDSEKYAID